MTGSAATSIDFKQTSEARRARTTRFVDSSAMGVPTMAEIQREVTSPWKPVIIWAAAAVTGAVVLAIGILLWAVVVTNQRQETVEATRRENQALHVQVDTNTRQTECRSRVVNAAEAIRAERDSLGWQSLVDRASISTPEELALRARQMTALNQQLINATDLRSRSIELCSADPNFTPPTPAIPEK